MTRAASLVMVVLLQACTAYRVPALSGAPREAPEHPSLGVARLLPPTSQWDPGREHLEEFVTRLRAKLVATGVFDDVVLEGPADVLVASTFEPRHCFSEPLMTVVTLGIVPNPGCYFFGYRLSLDGVSGSAAPVVVDTRTRAAEIWGWLALPLSALPGWSRSLPEEQEVYSLRAALLDAIGTAAETQPERVTD